MSSRAPDALFDEGTVAVWTTRPNFVFTQIRTSHYTVAQAQTFIGPIMNGVRRQLNATRYVWVSDSRRLATYEPGSRGILTDWCIAQKHTLERVVIIVSPEQKLIRMGTQVAAIAAIFAGIRMSIETEPGALEAYGVTSPFDL